MGAEINDGHFISSEDMTSEQDAYDELSAYTLTHGDPSFIHQHVVDAFAAQQAAANTKPITLTFALVGLYLRVEKRSTGRWIQRVHTMLAQRKQQWPTFPLPRTRGAMSAIDVMRAPAGPERDQAIDAWCASVWAAFRDGHQAVEKLLRDNGIEATVRSHRLWEKWR
jgi:hypothetical protein